MDFFGQDQLVGWLIAMTFGIVLAYAVWQWARVQRRKRSGEAIRYAADTETRPTESGLNSKR